MPLLIAPQTGILSLQLLPWELGTFLFQCRFLFLPPIKVSSISTMPSSIVLKIGVLKVFLKRCKANQADFWVIPIYLSNWQEEMPFLFEK